MGRAGPADFALFGAELSRMGGRMEFETWHCGIFREGYPSSSRFEIPPRPSSTPARLVVNLY